jgi:hypothetical protein
MRPSLKMVALVSVLPLVGAMRSGLTGLAGAREEPKSMKTARGGTLAKTERHQFEVFFFRTGLRLFPQDSSGKPVDASRLTGTATFYHPNTARPWFSRPLRAEPAGPGQVSSLEVAVGLDNVPATSAKVTFDLSGLPDAAESTATFTVPVEFVPRSAPSGTTQPAVPRGGVTTVPRYTYGPGYYGFGYYEYTSPGTYRQEGRPIAYSTPSRHSTSSSGFRSTRDWSTGRDTPIAKPWLRPMD